MPSKVASAGRTSSAAAGQAKPHRSEERITWFSAMSTYLCYVVLMLFGNIRDAMGKCTGRSRYFSAENRPLKVRTHAVAAGAAGAVAVLPPQKTSRPLRPPPPHPAHFRAGSHPRRGTRHSCKTGRTSSRGGCTTASRTAGTGPSRGRHSRASCRLCCARAPTATTRCGELLPCGLDALRVRPRLQGAACRVAYCPCSALIAPTS